MVNKRQPAKKEIGGSEAGVSGSISLEEALVRSEERYRTILEQMQDSYYEVDLAGNYTFVSESVGHSLGYSREELLGQNYRLTALEEDTKGIFAAFNAVYRTGKPNKGFAHRIRHKDGSIKFSEVSIDLNRNEQREVIGFKCVSRDITERKQVEAALKDSEQNYRLLAAYHKRLNDFSISFSEAVDTHDLFNRIAETFRLLTGAVASSFSVYEQETRELKVVSLSIDPVKQDKVSSVFGPDMLGMRIPVSEDDLTEMFSIGIRRPKDLCELSLGMISQDLSDSLMDAAGCQQIVALAITYATELTGTCVAYLPADQPVVPDEALKTYIYLSGMAIKRRKTEDALRESEANYRLLAQHTTDTVWLMDMNLKLTYHSPSQEKLRGLTHQEIRDIPLEQTLTPESLNLASAMFLEELPRVEADPNYNPVRILELEYYRKDGTTVWAESKFSIIRDGNGKAVSILGEGRDVTDRKRAEAYREMGREVLQILNEPGNLQDSIRRVLAALKTRTGFDAVGIRLQDGDDFPYFAQQGFSKDFLLTENTLVERAADGGICRDKDGNVSLECTCGLVISGKTNPANPYFTRGGSCWTNDEAVTPFQDTRLHPRDRCVHDGFQSVALVPIKNKERIVGLIQINDLRKGRLTLEMVELLEGIASHIGEALMRKRAEEAVLASEARFKSIIEHVNDIFYIQNAKREILYISPQVEQMLGHTLKEMQNGWQNYLTDNPVNLAGPEKSQLAITTGEKQPPYLLEFIRSDGTKRLAEINESPLKNDKGEVIGIIGAARDITERKRAEDALRENEEQLRTSLENAPEGVYMNDLEGNFLYGNRRCEEIIGYNREELIGKNFLELNILPECSLAKAAQILQDNINGKCTGPDDLELINKDGRCIPVEINTSIVPRGGERVVLAFVRDISERKRVEDALKESEEKYRSLIESALVAVIVIQDGLIRYVNPHAFEIMGQPIEQIEPSPFMDFIHPDDRAMVIDRYLRRQKGEQFETVYPIRLVDNLGNTKWVQISVATISWEGKPATLISMADITDRKRLEEEQQRVEKLESVGLLAGGIAHDFNNILTAILGNISLAMTEAAPGSELLNSLEQAEKASLRAKDLTVQLLTFSRGGAPVTKLTSLAGLLKDTAGFALRGSNVKCHFSIPAGLWHAEIDAGQVSQVIHNLVINAQQAMPTGGTIEITAENMALSKTQSLGKGLPLKKGNYIRIAVTDHGSGIAAKHLARIFDPFFTTKQKGSGLGLATSFSIARNHGGHLSVESEPGAGSTFYLYLPASTQTPTAKKAKKEQVKPVGKARILVMDDEQGVREVAGRMLKHIGYKDIEFASDGAAAVKLYKAAMKSGNPFSVVILDLTIPGGMGGKETIRKLLKIDPGVKAIVSSGYTDDSVMAEYRGYGFRGMAAKPYTLEQLGKALQDVIG